MPRISTVISLGYCSLTEAVLAKSSPRASTYLLKHTFCKAKQTWQLTYRTTPSPAAVVQISGEVDYYWVHYLDFQSVAENKELALPALIMAGDVFVLANASKQFQTSLIPPIILVVDGIVKEIYCLNSNDAF